MKKVLFTFLMCISFLFLVNIKAETYNTTTCDITPNGEINIRWNKERETIGVVYAQSCSVTYSKVPTIKREFKTKEAALEACRKEVAGMMPSCCSDSDPKTGCAGSDVCSQAYYGCEAVQCDSYTADITFDSQGGSSCDSKTGIKIGSAAGSLCTPTKSGLTFGGWYTAANGGGSSFDSSSIVNGNTKLYALWKINISYNNKGGSGCSSTTINVGASIGNLCSPTKKNYKFTGWEYSSGSKVNSSDKPTSNITVYATWILLPEGSITCEAGKYVKAGTSTCSKCLSNNYCPGGTYEKGPEKDAGIRMCPAAYPSSAAGSKSDSECYQSCPTDKYYSGGGRGCIACTGGKVANKTTVYNGDTSKCICPTGKYEKNGKCETCPDGKYINNGKCETCPKGYACRNGGKISCTCKETPKGSSSCKSTCFDNDVEAHGALFLPNSNTYLANTRNNITNVYKILTAADDINGGGAGSAKVYCSGYYYKYNTIKTSISSNCSDSEEKVTSISYRTNTGYNVSSGDAVYCLQPGKNGPGENGIEYVDKLFDVMNCADQFKLKDGTKKVECGLANILYQTVKYDETNKRYVSNGKYTEGEITFALRLWMAAYSDTGIGNIITTSDDPEINWVPKEDYYKKTVTAVNNNTYNPKVSKSNSYVVGCPNGNSSCGVTKAIELYKNAKNATKFDYLETETTKLENPSISYEAISKVESEITIRLPESYKNSEIETECKNIKDSKCRVKVEIYDEDGNKIGNESIQSGYCTKEKCVLKFTPPTRVCQKYEGMKKSVKYKVEVKLRVTKEKEGWIRFYTAKSNPNNYQIMVSFLFNKKYCEDQVVDSYNYPTFQSDMYIDCGCTNRCEDVVTTKNLPNNCSDENEYENGSIKDPNMNCIINACYESDKNEYNYSNKFNVNTKICKIYCRDEVEFYLPGKVSTYAGMQFSYDLGGVLERKNIISKSPNTNKLTGVVINKKQCTSEIDYNAWYEEYKKLLNTKVETTITTDAKYRCKISADIKYDCSGPGKPSTYYTQPPGYEGCDSCDSNGYSDCTDVNDEGTFFVSCIKKTSYSCSYNGFWNGSACYLYDMSSCPSGYREYNKKYFCSNGSLSGQYCYVDGVCSSGGVTEPYCEDSTYIYNENTGKCEKTAMEVNRELLDQWIYDLYNCNLYSNSDISSTIKKYTNATFAGTSKEYIISQAKCTTEDCLSMTINYEDNVYGNSNTLSKDVKVLNSDSNKTYYCKDTNSKKCYEYEEDKEVELKGTNTTTSIDYINGKINVPTNDYASITISTQNEFYQSKQYQAEVYTGDVSVGDGSDSSHTPLAKNSYPVSKNTPTGSYNIIFDFSKVTYKNSTERYQYSCKYDVYNTTVLYDCAVKDENGNIDLSKCNNNCYEIEDGVPVIKSECINWESSNKKQYGYIYRNVDLGNLFPNAVIDKNGISTRNGNTNWSSELQAIDDIQSSAKDIYLNDNKYLEGRYVLTPQSIKEIKEYNKKQLSKGGYNNNTLENCEKVKIGNVYLFKNCKSTFLKELKTYTDVKVGGKISVE